LSEPSHRRIVHGHLGVHPQYLPSLATQPQTKLGFLSGEDFRIEPADLSEGFDSNHEDPAAGERFAGRLVPLDFA
jgi:hypothetical protein